MSPSLIFILSLALALPAAGLLIYSAVALARIWKTRRQVPTARAGVALAAAHPPAASVCVIIPAHNEEHALPLVIASLRAQEYPSFRVVLALDRCTDGSVAAARAAIGEDPRFEVIEISECPDDWAGKVHAVWSGMRRSPSAACAEYLLFADADTVFAPECLRAAIALAAARRLDLLSLLSTLTHDRWFERIVQPAAGLELVRRYPIIRANREHHRRPFANGQFMLFRRGAYEAIGGHERVREELLEDLALARTIDEHGLRAGVFLADNVLRCRMYPTWPAFRRGWKRIYTEAARRKPSRLRRAATQLAIAGSALPVLAVVGVAWSLAAPAGHVAPTVSGVLSAAGLFAWFVSMAWVHRLGHAPIVMTLTMPIGSWIVAGILREAARDLEAGTPTEWGGRRYLREKR